MRSFIDKINFEETEAMKYYSMPSTWSVDKQKQEVRNRIFSGDWVGAEKKDGFFAKVVKDEDGNIMVFSRSKGVDGIYANKIEWLPHLNTFFAAMPNGTCLLGELYLPSSPGSKNVTTVLGCLKDKAIARQEIGEKIHFYIFDCLAYSGQSMLKTKASTRFTLVESLIKDIANINPYVSTAIYHEGNELWNQLQLILANGGEGIVIINKSSFYEPGKRSTKTSLKVKKTLQETVDCFFTGRITPPTHLYTGKELETWTYWENMVSGEKMEGLLYDNFMKGENIQAITRGWFNNWAGSLEIGVMKNGKIYPIGFLSGLTDEVKANYRDYKFKVIEITCMEIMYNEDGSYSGLRHAKMLGFRDDKNYLDCDGRELFGE